MYTCSSYPGLWHKNIFGIKIFTYPAGRYSYIENILYNRAECDYLSNLVQLRYLHAIRFKCSMAEWSLIANVYYNDVINQVYLYSYSWYRPERRGAMHTHRENQNKETAGHGGGWPEMNRRGWYRVEGRNVFDWDPAHYRGLAHFRDACI